MAIYKSHSKAIFERGVPFLKFLINTRIFQHCIVQYLTACSRYTVDMKFNNLWHSMIMLFLLEFTCACLSSTADKITTPKTDKLQYVEWSPVSDHLVSGRGEGLLLSTHFWTRNVKAGTALQILVHTCVLSASHFGQYILFI